MGNLKENIDAFVTDLLHINDVDKNKLIDLGAGDAAKTFYLYHEVRESVTSYMLSVIAARFGKPGNTALHHSAPAQEQIIGKGVNTFEWKDGKGERDPLALKRFIESVYKELSLKGNNPLFLSIGALNWRVHVKQGNVKDVRSPLLLFPIRLVRTDSENTPVFIEFVQDDIYINPCLMAKLRAVWGEKIVEDFPHPGGQGVDVDTPVDIETLGDGAAYFDAVEAYVSEQRRSDIEEDTTFFFDRECVAILQYNHEELCMYYDIKRNREKIYEHPLIRRIFSKNDAFLPAPPMSQNPQGILPRDSTQEEMIRRVINGESLIIKGPPGTGKTLTITNMIASLLSANKKVMLSSQKPAAMFEVYAKLPEELRKFVMLLDCETETQAAKLNPTDVRMELAALINEAKSYRSNNAGFDELSLGRTDVGGAQNSVKAYVQDMFGEDKILGMSFFEVLDRFCNVEAEPIRFAEPETVFGLARPVYLQACNAVEDATKYYEKLSRTHTIQKCPWRPLVGTLSGVDHEAALRAYADILVHARALLEEISPILSACGIAPDRLPVGVAQTLMEQPMDAALLEVVRDPQNRHLVDRICEAIRRYRKEYRADLAALTPLDAKAAYEHSTASLDNAYDKELPVAAFLGFCENWKILELASEPTKLKLLLDFYKLMQTLYAERDELEAGYYRVYRRDLPEENYAQIQAANALFAKYMGKGSKKPKILDFKAKKAYESVKGFGYGAAVAFADAVSAAESAEKLGALLSNIEEKKAHISALFKIKFSDGQMQILFDLLQRCLATGRDIAAYVKALAAVREVFVAASKLFKIEATTTLGELRAAMRNTVLDVDLESALDTFTGRTERSAVAEQTSVQRADMIFAIDQVLKSGVLGVSDTEVLQGASALFTKGCAALHHTRLLREALAVFSKTHFESYYTYRDAPYSVADLQILCDEALDKSVLATAIDYLELIYSGAYVLPLERFFRPFELGVRTADTYSFAELFEHSVLFLAIQEKLARTPGADRYGVGERMNRDLDTWRRGISRMDKAHLSLIEQQCISRIRPNDEDFAFLNAEKGSNETLRKMFKKYAAAILKLKKCFILSPSSVSVFFGREEFSDFDIVIVDEASQLEPTAILPVLVRAKQVVLVGDEWQMPPIRHFVSRASKRVTDDEGNAEYLNPDTSVLSLALNNCAFPVEQLLCHYRSRTESLITFSQRSFYKYMRTFPTPVPKKPGLGFCDIYTPNGYCEDAVNTVEAEKAVDVLREHFERYYDPARGTLSESIGIVAFGQKQTDYIRALVKKDKELEKKLMHAIACFNDVPEKLIFFKTIETVQGQETDHLVLSLTYGRNKNGATVQSFGELNRGAESADKLGQCIFNVAVTRAKSSVTMIHSVSAEEITNPNVEYIANYLRVVEQFSRDGREQFVGDTPDTANGFLRSVANSILALGFDPVRVVLNFGVTEGSVRIPIAILSEDQSRALLGIWCERDVTQCYDYFDYNVRFFDSLRARGWTLHKLYIHDWVENREAKERELKELLLPLLAQ